MHIHFLHSFCWSSLPPGDNSLNGTFLRTPPRCWRYKDSENDQCPLRRTGCGAHLTMNPRSGHIVKKQEKQLYAQLYTDRENKFLKFNIRDIKFN